MRFESVLPNPPWRGPPIPSSFGPQWPWIQKPNLVEKRTGNQPPVSNPVNEIEEMTQRKREEFQRKGYPPGQIEKALLWAREWTLGSTGVKATFNVSPTVGRQVYKEIYKQALDLSNRWIESLAKS